MSGIVSSTSTPPPAARDSHDQLEGLERLICQKHDELQLLMNQLLLQQTKVLDARLEEVVAKITLEKQKGAVCEESQIAPALCVSSQTGLGHSIHANIPNERHDASDLRVLASDNMLPSPSSKSDCGKAELLQENTDFSIPASEPPTAVKISSPTPVGLALPATVKIAVDSQQKVDLVDAGEKKQSEGKKQSEVVQGYLHQRPSNWKKLNEASARMTKRLVPGEAKLVQKMDENDGHHWLIHNHILQAVVHVCILANALQFGLQVDLNFGQWNTCWTVLDNVFTAVFAIEMILSICCLGVKYFKNRWHLLDFFVACSSIIDIWLLDFAFGNSEGHVMLRFFRFLRLLRMVKVLRMRRDLHLLMTGIADSTSPMLWVAVLLSLIIYTAAIVCVEVVGDASLEGQYSEKDFDNQFYFGTMLRAMNTLFDIAIGDTWSDIIKPVSDVQPYMVPVFLIFLVMTTFALLNALIGIIVDKTTAATQVQQELEEVTKRQGKEQRVRELIQLVSQIDENSDKLIKRQEMEDAMRNPAFEQIIEGIEMPAGFSGTDLHTMLDLDGSGALSVDEFMNGMFQLIYSNQFQSQCLTKLSVGKIQQSVFQLHQDMLEQMCLLSQQFSAVRKAKL